MWNLYPCNKIIQQRTRSKSYEIHRKKLSQMQPIMKIQTPYQPDFIYTKNKLNMSRRDKRVQIDRLNKILLEKMEGIKDQDYTQNKLRPQAQNLKTLNSHTIDIINQQIATENQRFCKKLMKTKSFYPTNNILQKTEQLDYISTNISINARRANSVRNLHSARSRPRSSYTTNFSIQKKISKENFISNTHQIKTQFRSERPETAPMFARSQKNLVPRSVKPIIQQQIEIVEKEN